MPQELINTRKRLSKVIIQGADPAIRFLRMIISDADNMLYSHLNINFTQNSVNLARQDQSKFA